MVTRVGVRNAVHAALVACGASASLSLSLPASALGLGEIDMRSFLNEPLRADVELLDTRQLTVDDIRIRLAGVEDFDRLGVERSFFLTSIQFEVIVDEATGRGVIRLSTEEAVLEPYLDLIIEARWPSGRLLREYTVLVDPPAFRREAVTVSASERVAATRPEAPAQDRQPTPPSPRDNAPVGDRVVRRESSLPPGEMPDRRFSAETADTPRAGNRYMVRRDETLWQIARRGRPEDVSVQQAMLDIQRLNPEAFIDGNINRIKAGYIIYLPAAGEITSDDLARALDQVREQNQEWAATRTEPGVTAAATLRVSADTMPPETRTPTDSASVTAGSGGTAVRVDAASGSASRLPAVSDPSAQQAPGSASTELLAQLENMAQRLDTLEQIVALKDEQIATLEQALRGAREVAAEAVTPDTTAVAAAPPPAATTMDPTTVATATTPVTTPTPATTPRPSTPAPSQSSGFSIPWLPIGGGILVVALGVLLFFRRRLAGADAGAESVDAPGIAVDSDGDDVFAGVSLKREALADPLDDDDVEEAVTEAEAPADADVFLDKGKESPGLDAGGSRGYGERKHDDYIDEGAAGDALAEADIYIAYGRYLQAIELLDTAIESDPANSAYRVKLIELYVDMGEAESAEAQMEALRQHGDADAIERGEALLGAGASHDDDDVLAGGSFDADTDDDLDDAPATLAPLAEEALSDHGAAADESMDLDLDPLEASPANAAEAAQDTAADALDDDAEGLGEIQFEDLEIEEEDSVTKADIGFAEHIGYAGAEEELDLTEALPSSMDELSESVTEDEPEDLMIADDADQMATKLDLARAYIDMGDSAGARTILEEVAANGTDAQQQEANELMSRVG